MYRIVRIWVGEEICRLLVKALSRPTEHKVKGQCGLFFLNSRKYSFLINQFLMMYCAFKYRNGWWSCFLRFSPLALFVKTSRKRMSPSSQISLFSINASHVTLHQSSSPDIFTWIRLFWNEIYVNTNDDIINDWYL